MTKPLEVWVVDDDASIRWVLERALRQGGTEPRTFEHADAALAALATRRPDVLLTDVRMLGTEGMRLLEIARRDHPELPVIVMTAHSDLEHAVAAYRGGAFEYLPKPFDVDQAVELIRRALDEVELRDAVEEVAHEAVGRHRHPARRRAASALRDAIDDGLSGGGDSA